MDTLTMAQKQERKVMFCELVEAENKGIHKYVDAIKIAPEHRKMLQSIMNEEFQHIRLLNELIKDLGEVSEMEMNESDSNHTNESHENHSEASSTEIPKDENSSEMMAKPQGTMVTFKRSK